MTTQNYNHNELTGDDVDYILNVQDVLNIFHAKKDPRLEQESKWEDDHDTPG